MKVLIVNGSPHTYGGTAGLLKAIVEGIGDGHDVEWVNVYELHMAPCRGCLQCRPDNVCVLEEDDGHRLGKKMRAADALVIGTPTYWANITAPLKQVFDRNVPVFMHEVPNGFPAPHQKGKRAAIVATCNTPWPINILLNQSRGAVKAIKAVLGYGGYHVVGVLERGDMRDKPDFTPRDIERARAIGRRIIA